MSNASRRASALATHLLPWRELTPEQLAAWSGFLWAHAQVVRELDTDLEREHELPLTSYDVLFQLGIAADQRLRMLELADKIVLSRSELASVVDRLEQGGLVERGPGDVEPREIYVRMTDRGLEVLAEATPTHISGIKKRFLERLSDEQTKQLAVIWPAVLRR
jgi:DNA-binding MarR family transcriptional regulator